MNAPRFLRTVALVALVLAGAADAYFSSSWLEDADGYAKAVKQQRVHDAPILVYFRVDWCPHCRNLDAMLEDSELRSRLNRLIKVRVNPEHGEKERKIFGENHGGRAYPSLYLSTAEGRWTKLRYSPKKEQMLAQLPE